MQVYLGPEYVRRVIAQSETGEGYLDYGDTPAFKGIYEAAATVVGSVLAAAEETINGAHLYPGTGFAYETGKGDAQGTKLNLPQSPGANDNDFLRDWPKAESFIRSFAPEFIILQCGVDSIYGEYIAMGKRIYVVCLSKQERTDLQRLVKTGKAAAFKRQRAQILLNVDRGEHGPSLLNTEVARMFDLSIKTVERACKKLVDEDYPDAKKIRLVMDNLNTHMGASLYKTFEPKEARRLLDKLEFHYTPKHGSWLI